MIHTRLTRLLQMATVVTCCLAWLPSPALADVVSFEWATVGNPGNAGDVQTQGTFGSVGNTYRISKHEVTNAQYSCFLNAVAATDTNGLYNANMGSNDRGGITQSGSSGSFTYSVRTNMGNKPVNYVSFFDAMRFTNWLHNGQGTGNTESGVYTIGSGLDEVRQAGATYFIPSEDEWFKAAYHKNDGVTGNYWDYPTSSDTFPTQATADGVGNISNPGLNVVNYNLGADWNVLNGNVTTVGSATSISSYGTFDQAGNVLEWNEAFLFGSSRGLRGGSWLTNSSDLAASFRNFGDPWLEADSIGFRVASLPVPPVVTPDTVTTTRGLYVAGDAASLAESDNADYQLRRAVADTQSRTEFEVKGISPTSTPVSFEFTLEGAVFARSNVVQTIELFDYDSASWELVSTTNAARSPAPDSVVTAAPTGDLSRFVEAGTMCIEARIHFQSDSPRQRFASNTDQAIWTIGQ